MVDLSDKLEETVTKIGQLDLYSLELEDKYCKIIKKNIFLKFIDSVSSS